MQVTHDRTDLGGVGRRLVGGACTRRSTPAPTSPESDIIRRPVPPATRFARQVCAGCCAALPRVRAATLGRNPTAVDEPIDGDADHAEAGGNPAARHRHATGAVHSRLSRRRHRDGFVLGLDRLRTAACVRDGVRRARGAPASVGPHRRGALPADARCCFVGGHDDSPSGELIGASPSGEPIGTAAHGQRGFTAAQVYSTAARVFGGVAQLVERFGRIEEARGSIPLTSTASVRVRCPC